ncbi:hypothetical protein GCK32_002794, partial [Trichostrongylus colubriformis]
NLNVIFSLLRFAGGVLFKQFDTKAAVLDYAILKPVSFIAIFLDPWHLDEEWDNPFGINIDHDSIPTKPPYWSSGFLSLQYAIDSLFIQASSSNVTFLPELSIRRIPEPKQIIKSVAGFLNMSHYFWGFCAFVLVIHTAREIAGERSTVKDFLSVMGLSRTVFYLSHVLYGLLKILLVFLVCAAPLLTKMGSVSVPLFVVVLVLYGVSAMVFAAFMSSLFKKPNTVLKVTIVLWIVMVVVVYWAPRVEQILYCTLFSINPHAAFAYAIMTMADYLGRGKFFLFSEITPNCLLMLNFSMFMALDRDLSFLNIFEDISYRFNAGAALVMLLLDIIWMSAATLFFDYIFSDSDFTFFKFLCCGKYKRSSVAHLEEDGGNNETDEGLMKTRAGISVQNLIKVTALLGQNGAGKSTTFSVICGITAPTSGRVCIDDLDVKKQLSACRKYIGLCPQANALFDRLTVNEHLWLIHGLKGAKGSYEDEAKQLLDQLKLDEKSDEYAKNLSGGQKRKLCMSMAVIGDSPVILLDEPTAGMDPRARRDVETLLETIKVDRTVLLTTHYLDEAELLGDRIAIMAKGRVYCCGTPQFLKKSFPELFEYMENSKDSLQISSFGLALNTLEQVFLPFLCFLERSVGCTLTFARLRALFTKRFMYCIRNWSQLITQVLTPLGILLLIVLLSLWEISISKGKVRSFSAVTFGPSRVPVKVEHMSPIVDTYLGLVSKVPGVQTYKLMPRDQLIEWAERLPKKMPPAGYGAVFARNSVEVLFTSRAYHSLPSSLNAYDNAQLKVARSDGIIHTQLQTLTPNISILGIDDIGDKFRLLSPEVVDRIIGPFLVLALAFATSPFVIYLVEERVSKFAHQQSLTGISPLLFWAGSFFFDFLLYSVVCACCLVVFLFRGWMKGYLGFRFQVANIEEDPAVAEERVNVQESREDMALEVKDLCKMYGRLKAVDGLTMGVRDGECFGLLGPNGAGKTSTFDILTGQSFATDGSAVIGGQDVKEHIPIGYCPQFDALLLDLTGRETLEILARMHGFPSPREIVELLLQSVSMEDQADKLLRYCSGGQRRKISVALALLTPARIIILDEPTAGIDPKARRQIWELLSMMRESLKLAILLTSHSMDECEALCSRIAILLRGKMIAIGTSQELKSKFGKSYTIVMVAPDVESRSKVIDAVSGAYPTAVLKTPKGSLTLSLKWQKEKNRLVLEPIFKCLRPSPPPYVSVTFLEISSAEALQPPPSSMCECLRQLWLLTRKNFILTRRNRIWTVFELLLPILFTLPITILIAKNGTIEFSSEVSQLFKAIPLEGGAGDITRNVGFVSSIRTRWCNREKVSIAYFARENQDSVEKLMTDLAKRFSSAEITINWIKMSSEENMLSELRADAPNTTHFGCAINRFAGGIVFNQLDTSTAKLDYVIFISTGFMLDPWHLDQEWSDPFGPNLDYNSIPKEPPYWSSAFLSLQYAIDSLFIEKSSSNVTLLPELRLRRIPEPKQTINTVADFLKYSSYLWGLCAFVLVIHTAREITSERSTVKDFLSVMGLSAPIFYLSHVLYGSLKILLVLLICAIPLCAKIGPVSVSLFVIALILYGVSAVVFAALISSLFKKPNNVLKVVIVLWVILVAAQFKAPRMEQILFCTLFSLNPNAAFSYALRTMSDYMNRGNYDLGRELSFRNIFEDGSFHFTAGAALLMLLVDIMWMSVATLIFDYIFSDSDFTFFKLPFGGLKYVSSSAARLEQDDGNNETDEGLLRTRAGISVQRLIKVWSSTGERAVDNMSLEAYVGQVTVLLGQNGAGKSTTFSVICGITAPTAGRVSIYDLDIQKQRSACRKRIGLCPQGNALFDRLTVDEHLWLIHGLKGASGSYKVEGQQLLEQLKLDEKSNELAMNLSGGQKRKLCVSMAVIGDSQVVLLDEPTAGMDPRARRDVEALLETIKVDRTVLLTTHYLDEAELLGDRVAIMAKGRVYCCGTPQFLKKRFGTGYIMTVVVAEKANAQDVADTLARIAGKYVIGAEKGLVHGKQFEIILPKEHQENFPQLFEYLENSKDSLRISSFGLSMNTMEQVFLKVAENTDPTAMFDFMDARISRNEELIQAQQGELLRSNRDGFKF